MSDSKEWIFVVVFFALYLVVTLGEIYWLTRAGVAVRRAMIFVFTSNFVTITLGFLVSFLIFALLLSAMQDENAQMPIGETGILAASLTALLFPVFLMAGMRRLLLLTLGIEQLGKPLIYVVASSFIFFIAVVGLPVLFLYIF